MGPIGIITEQGDLGLGFDPVNESDQESLKEKLENNNNKDDEE